MDTTMLEAGRDMCPMAMLAQINVPALISRWLHILAVITAVGGTIFIRLALLPSVKATLTDEQHETLRRRLMPAWGRLVHISIFIIILSGIYNAIVIFPRLEEPMPYHAIFGVKFVLALVLFFFAIALTGRSNATAGIRRNTPKWMAANIIIAMIIVFLSNILKFTSSHLGTIEAARDATGS